MDGRIHSSSDQSEINSFPFEIGSSNVEYFSLQGDTMHSRKRKKGQWDIGRKFKVNWVSRYLVVTHESTCFVVDDVIHVI